MMVIGAVIAHNLRNVDVCAQLFCAIMGSARNLRNGDISGDKQLVCPPSGGDLSKLAFVPKHEVDDSAHTTATMLHAFVIGAMWHIRQQEWSLFSV